jgi:3-carboxy-cis,cis-muconate cycloisomerase
MDDGSLDHTSADVGLLSPFWAGTPVARATSDQALLDALIEVELALVDAYVGLQLAPATVAATIRSVTRSNDFDTPCLAVRARDGGNPVIPLVTDLRGAVAAVDAEAAGWVHRGATSQDILDTALMLTARRALAIVLDDAQTTITALAALADRHRKTLMAARTLTQHSVPTSFGLKAAGWLHGVVRAIRRLDGTRAQLCVQWGGAGGTLASFALLGSERTGIQLQQAIAAQLNLKAPLVPWHTQRAFITEAADAATQLSDALGKIATDVLVLVRPEIGELKEPHAAGRGVSSAMPQKHNPVLSVLINGATHRAPSLAADLHRSANAVDERPDGAWHGEWSAFRELLRLVGGAAHLATQLIPGLIVNTDTMLANVRRDGPLIVSERLMLEFGSLVGKEKLQEMVTAAVRDSTVDLAATLRAEPSLAMISDERLAASLDPSNYLGAADDLITRVLDDLAAQGLKG